MVIVILARCVNFVIGRCKCLLKSFMIAAQTKTTIVYSIYNSFLMSILSKCLLTQPMDPCCYCNLLMMSLYWMRLCNMPLVLMDLNSIDCLLDCFTWIYNMLITLHGWAVSSNIDDLDLFRLIFWFIVRFMMFTCRSWKVQGE